LTVVNSAADAQLNASGASIAAAEQRLKEAEHESSASTNSTKDHDLLVRVAKVAEEAARKLAASKAKAAAEAKSAKAGGFTAEEIATAEDAETLSMEEDPHRVPTVASPAEQTKPKSNVSFHVE
jgi:hypothetical protein